MHVMVSGESVVQSLLDVALDLEAGSSNVVEKRSVSPQNYAVSTKQDVMYDV